MVGRSSRTAPQYVGQHPRRAGQCPRRPDDVVRVQLLAGALERRHGERPSSSRPAALAAIASTTVDMPTRSAPRVAASAVSATVCTDGPRSWA